jgi:hypothetical protein
MPLSEILSPAPLSAPLGLAIRRRIYVPRYSGAGFPLLSPCAFWLLDTPVTRLKVRPVCYDTLRLDNCQEFFWKFFLDFFLTIAEPYVTITHRIGLLLVQNRALPQIPPSLTREGGN